MALRKQKYQAAEAVASDNEAWLRSPNSNKERQAVVSLLAVVVASWLDGIAKGDITHVTIGMPQARNAFLASMNLPDKSVARAGGVDLASLVDQMYKEFCDEDTGGGEGK